MRTLPVVLFLALAALAAAQSWHGRSSTPYLHLQYRENQVDNENLDKIDQKLQMIVGLLPPPPNPTTTTTTIP